MTSSEMLDEVSQNRKHAYALLTGVMGPTEQAIARKAMLQAAILAFPEAKKESKAISPIDIGIFRVFPTEATIDWSSPSGELDIKEGQVYLDFHIPKSDGISNETANEGYSLIAEYMRSHPDISYILGVTYRFMALSGRRNQGFNTEQIQLPEPVMNYATAYWQSLMPDKDSKYFETAHVVWQNRESFIDRFGNGSG